MEYTIFWSSCLNTILKNMKRKCQSDRSVCSLGMWSELACLHCYPVKTMTVEVNIFVIVLIALLSMKNNSYVDLYVYDLLRGMNKLSTIFVQGRKQLWLPICFPAHQSSSEKGSTSLNHFFHSVNQSIKYTIKQLICCILLLTVLATLQYRQLLWDSFRSFRVLNTHSLVQRLYQSINQ